jgi:hypothetical protein
MSDALIQQARDHAALLRQPFARSFTATLEPDGSVRHPQMIEAAALLVSLADEVVRLRDAAKVKVVRLGLGSVGLVWGHYYGVPAVFLEPLDHTGPVGKPLPEGRQLPKDTVLDGSVIITFATEGGVTVLVEEIENARRALAGEQGGDHE